MTSTDIDGSVIVILSAEEAQQVYNRLKIAPLLDDTEKEILRKIERDLKLEQPDETPDANQDHTTVAESSPPRSN